MRRKPETVIGGSRRWTLSESDGNQVGGSQLSRRGYGDPEVPVFPFPSPGMGTPTRGPTSSVSTDTRFIKLSLLCHNPIPVPFISYILLYTPGVLSPTVPEPTT